MKKLKFLFLLSILLLAFAFINSCGNRSSTENGGGTGTPSDSIILSTGEVIPDTIELHITVLVKDKGVPLQGAVVSACGQKFITDRNGMVENKIDCPTTTESISISNPGSADCAFEAQSTTGTDNNFVFSCKTHPR